MAVDYNRLDEIYKEIPEILDLVRAAGWVSQEAWQLTGASKRMNNSIVNLRDAGKALDNRNH